MSTKTDSTDVANVEDLQAIVQENPFEVNSTGDIEYILGEPRQWRADCSSSGGFKVGDNGVTKPKMKIEVIRYVDLHNTQLFPSNYSIENWILLFFVDDDNQFSTMLLKGRSRDNFIEVMRQIKSDGKNIGLVKMEVGMIEKQGKEVNGKIPKFKVVTFDFEENSKDRVSQLFDFWKSHGDGIDLHSNMMSDIILQAPVIGGKNDPAEQIKFLKAYQDTTLLNAASIIEQIVLDSIGEGEEAKKEELAEA